MESYGASKLNVVILFFVLEIQTFWPKMNFPNLSFSSYNNQKRKKSCLITIFFHVPKLEYAKKKYD